MVVWSLTNCPHCSKATKKLVADDFPISILMANKLEATIRCNGIVGASTTPRGGGGKLKTLLNQTYAPSKWVVLIRL
jgi:glutaredoxin